MTHPGIEASSATRGPTGQGPGATPVWLVRRALCVAIAASLAGPVLAQRSGSGQATAGMVVDGDADGVSDDVDDCPYSPPGVAVNARGCSGLPDQDGDGVPDAADVCPLSPRGARVAPDGCALDADGDKVADGLDYCPNTPRNQDVDEQGCAVNESAPNPPAFAAAPMGPGMPPLPRETVTTVATVTAPPSAPAETTVRTVTTVAPTDIVATVPAPPRYDRAAGTSVVASTALPASSPQIAPGLRIVRPDPDELARLRDAQRASAARSATTGPRVATDTSRLPRAPLGSETETGTSRRSGRKATPPPLPLAPTVIAPTVIATTTTTTATPTPDVATPTPAPAETATTTTVTTVAAATPPPVVEATRVPAAQPLRIVRAEPVPTPRPQPQSQPLRIVRPAPVATRTAAPASPEVAPADAVSRPIVSSLKPARRAGRGAGKAARHVGRKAATSAPITVAPAVGATAGTKKPALMTIPAPVPRAVAGPAARPASDLLYNGRLTYTGFTVEYRATLPAEVPVVVPEDTRASLNSLADRLRRQLAGDATLSYAVAGCRVVGRDTDDAPAQARAQAVGSILASRLGVAYQGRVGLDRPVSVDSAFLPARQACADVRAVHVAAAAGVAPTGSATVTTTTVSAAAPAPATAPGSTPEVITTTTTTAMPPTPAPAASASFLETMSTPTSAPVGP